MANLTEEVNEGAPPALFEHCVNTYRVMLAEAKPVTQMGTALTAAERGGETVVDLQGHGNEIMVYEGFFTQLVTSKLNLSVPYYTTVRRALMNMGCIRQLKRGGGTSPSQWELIYEPTLDAFMNQQPKREKSHTKTDAMREELSSLKIRVGEVEDQVQDLLEAWATQFGTTEKLGDD